MYNTEIWAVMLRFREQNSFAPMNETCLGKPTGVSASLILDFPNAYLLYILREKWKKNS